MPVLKKNRPLLDSETDPVRRQLFADYWSDDLVAGAAQLKRILTEARKDLARLHSKVLLLAGGADDVVPASVARYVEERARGAASFESKTLAGAGPLFPFDERAGEAAAVVRSWMEKP